MAKDLTQKTKAQSFYDQIADVQHLAQKIIGYRASLTKHLRLLKLDITKDSLVLDAGCGTGLATLSMYSAGYIPQKTFALDISFNSLTVAEEEFSKDKIVKIEDIKLVQGNLLSLPFADESLDTILTCGALEYVPFEDGLRELARILKPNGKLVMIPIRPSAVSSVLELVYKFKMHSLEDMREVSEKYFDIIANRKFPLTEPIGWSKTSFLLQKK